ncbi:MAG: shikimate kinase [Calditrichaeota bacterium]|nr:MAG: shikimate kinase [Calditrichota bacterium]
MKMKRKHIYLLGFMGCGKSTLGRKLAQALDMPFVDTDIMIEVKAGMSVTTIFAQLGETKFRELEKEILIDLAQNWEEDSVVALGGGTPAQIGAWPLLQASGTTVYVERTPEQLYNHVRFTNRRPVLQEVKQEELLGHIEKLLEKRVTNYLKADHIFNCKDEWGVDETIDHLVKLLKKSDEEN